MVKDVVVGQIVYVSIQFPYGYTKPRLHPEKVGIVNKTSFYTSRVDNPKRSNLKMSRKDWSCEKGGMRYQAYETEKEFWDMIKVKEDAARNRNTAIRKITETDDEHIEAVLKAIEKQLPMDSVPIEPKEILKSQLINEMKVLNENGDISYDAYLKLVDMVVPNMDKLYESGLNDSKVTTLQALRQVDTHIRCTKEPVPYIVDTLKETLPEYDLEGDW